MHYELKPKQGGLILAMFNGTAYAAPAASVAAFFGSGAGEVGRALPLTYIIAIFGALSAMSTNYFFTKRLQSAGGQFTFAYAGFGRRVGVFTGWLWWFYQFGTMACFTALIFPGIVTPYIPGLNALPYGWILIAVIALAIPFAFIWFGLKPSLYYTLIGSVLEIGFILLLSAVIIHGAGSSNTISVYGINGNSAGTMGFGIVYAVLSFIGIGSSVAISEELTESKKNLPWAIIFATLIVGATYAIASYAQTIGWIGPMSTYATATDPGLVEATTYGGRVLLVAFIVFISNSFISNAVAQANTMTRGSFGMAKHGVLFPKSWTETHEKTGAPRKNLVYNYAIVVPLFLFFGLVLGPFIGGTILITIIAIGYYITHTITNTSLPLFGFRVLKRSLRKNLPYILLPLPGSVIFLWAVIGSWSVFPPYPLLWSIWGSFIMIGIGIILALIYGKEKNPERKLADLHKMAQEEEAADLARGGARS